MNTTRIPRLPPSTINPQPSTVRASSVPGNDGVKIEISTTISRTPKDLFRFWRNFENLPLFMKNIESVQCLDSTHSHWTARASHDKLVEWDAEIINEHPNEMLAWRTLEGSDIHHAGSIWFRPVPGALATEVKLAVEYTAGKFADFLAKIFRRSPYQQMREDLRHFKQIMETGEVPAP